MPIDVRPAVISDIAGARDCLDAVARERRYLALLEAPPPESSQAWWSAMIAQGWPYEVAVDGARVVGWCDVVPERHPVHSHTGVLGMGLLAYVRGQGVGKRLLAATIEDARRCGLERIELTVYDSNLRARRLYEAAGFVVEGVRRRHRKLDGAYEDSLLMALLV